MATGVGAATLNCFCSFLSVYMYTPPGNVNLFPGQRQGQDPSWLSFLHVCAHFLAIVASILVRSSPGAGSAEAETQCRLRGMKEWSLQASQNTGFQSAASLLGLHISKSVHSFFKSEVSDSSSPLVKPTGFQTN